MQFLQHSEPSISNNTPYNRKYIATAEQISAYHCSAALMAADSACLLIAGLVPAALYNKIYSQMFLHYFQIVAVGSLILMLTAQASDAYATNRIFTSRQMLPRAIASLLMMFFVLMVVGVATKTTTNYSRVWFFSWVALALTFTVLLRLIFLAIIEARLVQGACLQRALIISCGGNSLTGSQLELETRNRVRAVGIISVQDLAVVPDLGPHLKQLSPDVVILSLPWAQVDTVMSRLKVLSQYSIEVLVLPQGNMGLQRALCLRRLGNLVMLQIAKPPLSGWHVAIKRAEDVAVAISVLLLFFPLLIATAIAIKLNSKGPVLFKQVREGFNGELIEIWKFRSMYIEGTDPNALHQTSRKDPRVTRVGRFIRRTSIDELPQFWNVLKGQMSVVGPRPHALATAAEGRTIDSLVEEYAARHRVKPGITGWAQINGARGELTSCEQVKRRVDLDLYYIENWSIFLDLKIILITAVKIFYDPHAY